ncbi:hypothetical protein ATCC90586_010564 [Pythium insidiosum]|nr:hypothetical protein ATCC90586_010564 [Pythium insidiosum]
MIRVEPVKAGSIESTMQGLRDELRESEETTFRVRGGGRKPVLGGFENELLDLIVERRVRKEKVSQQWIVEVAIGFGLTDFMASTHWLISRAVAYMHFLQSQLGDFYFERVVLMDETAVYSEDPRKHSVERVAGKKLPPMLVWKGKGEDMKKVNGYRKIGMCVIPGGMTPYPQAGDIGVYKSFKDKMAPLIDQWKRSDSVEDTRGGNAKCGDVDR